MKEGSGEISGATLMGLMAMGRDRSDKKDGRKLPSQ
jgi:hypothetical protein